MSIDDDPDFQLYDSLEKARGFFSIMGSLGLVMPKLLPLIPPHKNRLELFCGHGEMIWFTDPPEGDEILNDKDPNVMKMHSIVRNLSDEDLGKLGQFNWKGDRDYYLNLRDKVFHPTKQRLEWLHRRLYLYRFGRKQNPVGKDTFRITNQGATAQPIPRLKIARDRLKKVKLSCMDWKDALKQFDTPYTLTIADPPYPGREIYYPVADVKWPELLKALDNAKGLWLLFFMTPPDDHPDKDKIAAFARKHSGIKYRWRLPHHALGWAGHDRAFTFLTCVSNFKFVKSIDSVAKMPIEDISMQSIKNEDDKQLLNLHLRLHQLWAQLGDRDSFDGVSREDLANAHYTVVHEMQERKFQHILHDTLDNTLHEFPLEARKAYEEKAKPSWRIFALKDLEQISAFEDPDAKIVVEVKWDGERIQLQKHGNKIEVWSDYPRRVDGRLPSIAKELRDMDHDKFILDSEILMFDSESKECLHRTTVTAHLNSKTDPSEREGNVHCVVFDCLEDAGEDLRDKQLSERLEHLKKFKETEHIHPITNYQTTDPDKNALSYVIPRNSKRLSDIVRHLSEK